MSGEDYEVGYGRPPAQHRFKKGRSGNPKGRPKGSLDYRTSVQKTLAAPVTITEGGRRKRVSSFQATLMRLSEKALRGDMKAIAKVIDLATTMAAEQDAQQAERTLSNGEQDILARYMAAMQRPSGPDEEESADGGERR